IIQLSNDAIYVVKSSAQTFSLNRDDSNNDNNDLTALLLSLYKENYHLNDIDEAVISNIEEDIEETNQTPITSTIAYPDLSVFSNSIKEILTTSISSLVQFIPAILDFDVQSIGVPRVHSVIVINNSPDTLNLESISGTTVQFYCSFFTQKSVPSNSNTSFNIYFLPRSLGKAHSTLVINSNQGIFHYSVLGTGLPNPFRLRPYVGVHIPLNTSYQQFIRLHNPYNRTLEITEVYTSDDDLVIVPPAIDNIHLLKSSSTTTTIINNDFLFASTSDDTLPNGSPIHHFHFHKDYWTLKPYETKIIMKLNFLARTINKHSAFLCIKTNLNDTIILPIEMEVSNQPGLYTNIDLIEFGNGVIRSNEEPITIQLYVINNGPKLLTISVSIFKFFIE
ncbi:unnamed protein product, partial [Didymodactylos carnosus]